MRESANIYILTNPDTINGLLREPGNPLTEDLRTASEPEAYTLADKGIGDGNDPLFMIDLVFFPTAEGFYDYENSRYIYQYKDHLGNVRLSYTKNTNGTPKVLDINKYYPLGMNHLSSTPSVFDPLAVPYNYKYNGKELQETGLYDYGWRQYMPDIGRWNAMDQLAEMYAPVSPYAYVANNPISFIDPDGRAIDPVKDKDGNITGWTFTGVDANLVGGYFAGNGDFGSLVSQLEGYRGNFGSGPLSSFWSTFNSNRLNMKFVSTSSAGRNYFGANGVSHLATTVIDVSVMPFDDWVKSLGGNTESGFDWDKLNGNMGAFGLGNGIKTELIDYTIRSNYKSARSWWEFNKLESTEKAWRTTNTLGKTGANYLKFSKGLGTVVAAGTTAYSWYNTYDYYNNGGSDGKVLAKTVIDTIMTGVGFLGPIGFGISATYFILDYATDGFGGFGSIE